VSLQRCKALVGLHVSRDCGLSIVFGQIPYLLVHGVAQVSSKGTYLGLETWFLHLLFVSLRGNHDTIILIHASTIRCSK